VDLAVATGDGAVDPSVASGFKSWYAQQHADVSAQVAGR